MGHGEVPGVLHRRQPALKERRPEGEHEVGPAEVPARHLGGAEQVAGGLEAVQLRVAEQYLIKFGELAKVGNSMILPANVADVASMVATAMNVIKQGTPTEPSKTT